MADMEKVASDLLMRDEIKFGMVVCCQIEFDDNKKHLPHLSCVYSELTALPSDDGNDRLKMVTWYFLHNRWIRLYPDESEDIDFDDVY